MTGPDRFRHTAAAGVVALVLVAGCTTASTAVSEPPATVAGTTAGTPTARTSGSPEPFVSPVSASKPSPGAADAFEKCHIGDQIPFGRVTGMGEIASAADAWRYVPLTGREPILGSTGPAWIIEIHADIVQPGPDTEVWSDPTCIVTADDFGFLATGPITNKTTGKVTEPMPPSRSPDLRLPPLGP